MANYIKSTNFTAKDSLPSGDSARIVKGTEIDVEFTAISSAIASKSDSNSPSFTGTPTAPTAALGTNTTQLATTAFADAAAKAAFPVGGIILWSGAVSAIPATWQLCNGTNGTPDLRNRFIVGAGSTYAVNATGGSADSVVVAHTHTGTTGGQSVNHTHGMTFSRTSKSNNSTPFILSDPNVGENLNGSTTLTTGGVSSDHNHSFTTASSGGSGTNTNLPPYYALCYIQKMA
jgi:hypothetical protein